MPSAPAPRPRRWDHLGASVIGFCLVPMIVVLSSWAVRSVVADDSVTAVLVLVLVAAFLVQAQMFFARRSSVGGSVAALVMAFTSILAMLAPTTLWRVGHHSGVNHVFDCATGWISAALLFGGSIAMRRARRHGRATVIDSARHAAHDLTVGAVPVPPPSRRPDHIVSGVVSLVGLAVGLPLINASYSTIIGSGASAWSVLLFGGALVLLVSSASVGGRSSLGPRLIGTIVFLAPIPALVGCDASWCVIGDFSEYGPVPMTAMLAGAIVMSSGWGAHWARLRGQREQRDLMAVSQ